MNPATTLSRPVECIAAAIYSACLLNLPPISFKVSGGVSNSPQRGKDDFTKERRPTISDITVFAVFPQTWESPALGFEESNVVSITRSYTTIIECNRTQSFAVYFGNEGRLAYLLHSANIKPVFFQDVSDRILAHRKDAIKRYNAVINVSSHESVIQHDDVDK